MEFASFTIELKNTPGVHSIVRKACHDIETYWKQNVKKYFSASEIYGRGRYSTYKPSQIVDAIDVTYAIRHDRLYISVFIGDLKGKDNFDYLKALRYGVRPSKGAFVPYLGVRIDYGMHEGSTNEKWIKWSVAFEHHINQVMEKLQNDVVMAISRDMR